MNNIFIYRSLDTSPYHNLAIEEFLTANAKNGDMILYLWQNDNTVVVGKNQNITVECKAEELIKNGVHIVRRLSGGGTVYHDIGNLCFSFIADTESSNTAKQLEVICAACRHFGITAIPDGRNDISVKTDLNSLGKFSGNAFYQIGNNHCHHGTVLIKGDLEKMAYYLSASKKKLEAKGISSVRSRVVNLCEISKKPIDVEAFIVALCREFEAQYGKAIRAKLPSNSLIAEREAFFASHDWIFGTEPPFSDEVSERFGWGELTVSISIKHQTVFGCKVFSDSLDSDMANKLEKALIGQKFDRSAFVSAVSAFEHKDDISCLLKRFFE